MKKLVLIVIAIIWVNQANAQAPQSFSYQAVARGLSGDILANQQVSFRISILSGSASGTVVYSETHSGKMTNNYGLVDLEVGKGTVVTGSFSSINWGGNSFFMKVEMDPAGGTAYQNMGTSQMLSVPYALHANTASNVTDIGNLVTIGSDQTVTGRKTFSSDLKVNDITVGRGKSNIPSNTALGFKALFSNTTGLQNVAAGENALSLNTSGESNTSVGYFALSSNTTGSHNSALGFLALNSNTDGNYNTAVGASALSYNKTTIANTAVGCGALGKHTQGDCNTALGTFALSADSSGISNTALGQSALAGNYTGQNNTAVGSRALAYNKTGNYNVALGTNAGYWNVNGSRNVFIGFDAGTNETGSDKLYIQNNRDRLPLIFGDFSTGHIGIGTVSPTTELDVQGEINVNNHNIINVANPVNAGDAVNKAYVDSVVKKIEDIINAAGFYRVFDIEGNEYKVVRIGSQFWMGENLKVKKYNNGDAVSTTPVAMDISFESSPKYYWDENNANANVFNNAATQMQQLIAAGAGNYTLAQVQAAGYISTAYRNQIETMLQNLGFTPAQIAAMNINTIKTIFSIAAATAQVAGVYYTWYALTDSRKICPSGWHLPSGSEWSTLIGYLGGAASAGGHLKEKGTTYWFSPNAGADNSSDLKAIPSGVREPAGVFKNTGSKAGFWTSTSVDAQNSWLVELSYSVAAANTISADKKGGYSVRCIKD